MDETRWISSLLIYKFVVKPVVPGVRATHCIPVRSVQAQPASVIDVWLSDEKGGEVPGYEVPGYPDYFSVSIEQIGEPVNDKPESYPGEELVQWH